MVICGIELAASEARLVILEGTKQGFLVREAAPRRLLLTDQEDSAEVRAFRDAIHAYLRENRIELIAIKKRATRGDFAGGPVGFKLEGVIQLYEGCPVKLVPAATIAAALRNYGPATPNELRQYQQVAFQVAFAALPKA